MHRYDKLSWIICAIMWIVLIIMSFYNINVWFKISFVVLCGSIMIALQTLKTIQTEGG